MSLDFQQALAQKYAILGQQAQAAQTSAEAQALQARGQYGLYGAEAGKIGREAEMVKPLGQAQIGEAQARAGLYGAEAGKIGGLLPFEQQELQARTGQIGEATLGAQQQRMWLNRPGNMDRAMGVTPPLMFGGGMGLGLGLNRGTGTGDFPLTSIPNLATGTPYVAPATSGANQPQPSSSADYSLAKGTSKVHKGKPKGKGMVPAKLAPGEAVLTPGAAEQMGRQNIGMLNLMSHHGMLPSQGSHLGGAPHAPMNASIGMIPGLTPSVGGGAGGTGQVPGASGPASGGMAPMGRQSFAKGTSKVPGKPTTPSKDTVKATLPVGGAVLTNDAANHVGRGLIAYLNAMHGAGPIPNGQPSNVPAQTPMSGPTSA